MPRIIVRLIANVSILVGIYLIAKMIYGAVNGFPAAPFVNESQGFMSNTLFALALGLPVPFHVISVGLLLKRRWLSPSWARIAFPAAVISGGWLGVALLTKIFLLQ